MSVISRDKYCPQLKNDILISKLFRKALDLDFYLSALAITHT